MDHLRSSKLYTLIDNRKIQQEKINIMEVIANSKIITETKPKISFNSRAIYEKILQIPNSQWFLKQNQTKKFLDPLTPYETTRGRKIDKESSLFTNSWTESIVEVKDSNQEGNAASKNAFNIHLLKVLFIHHP